MVKPRVQFVILGLFFTVLIGCSSVTSSEAEKTPIVTATEIIIREIQTSTPLPTYTPYPTAELMPTKTPFPTLKPLAFSTSTPNISTATLSLPEVNSADGPTPTDIPPQGMQDVGAKAPDLAPILMVVDTGATCRGSSTSTEALFQLGVTNRGNDAARTPYIIEWTLGWDDFKGLIRKTEVNYHEWGLQWTVWLENRYMWVPCDETTTFTAYIHTDINNTVAEFYEDNNYAEFTYTITFVP